MPANPQGVLLALSLLVGFSIAYAETGVQASIAQVIDGDTLRVRLGEKIETVRLIGIDAPETRENKKSRADSQRSGSDLKTIFELGNKARLHCLKLAPPGTPVVLQFDLQRRDKYNRLLAYVILQDGSMLNERLVRDGFAYLLTIPPNTAHSGRLKAAFEDARRAKRGLWQAPPLPAKTAPARLD